MYINKKELRVPIIQGGMGVGVSLGNLAGSVAYEGGMGVISSVNAGFREEDFDENPVEANLRALKKEIQLAHSKAKGKGIVALNVMVAVNHYEETVKTAVDAGIEAIISGAGLPVDLPAFVQGSEVAVAPIVSSGKAAKLICRQWDKKFGRVPDFIVIEGPGAGGHLGFKREELLARTALTPLEILPEVLEQIKEYEEKYECKIPVFLAGGIFDGCDMAKAVEAGAAGVQIGTRFIATHECDASNIYKQVIVDASEEDAVIIHSPVGMPGRALNTNLIKKLALGEKLLPKVCNDCLKACPHGNQVPYCISRALISAVQGDFENGLFFCGENVGKINEIVSVHDLMEEIWQEYKKRIEERRICVE